MLVRNNLRPLPFIKMSGLKKWAPVVSSCREPFQCLKRMSSKISPLCEHDRAIARHFRTVRVVDNE
jgi:hypothetical protein